MRDQRRSWAVRGRRVSRSVPTGEPCLPVQVGSAPQARRSGDRETRSTLGQYDEFAGGLVGFHVVVGSNDVAEVEDLVDVGSVDAGLDLVDDPL